jgi:signal transduction histidine kinase
MMPKMDGFEVTYQIREDPQLPFIPILLITAYDHPSAVKGLDVGADDFIRKPVDVDELLARVRSLLRLKHSVDEREQMARMREDFVSRLTHDLRTPLVAADRMLTLLQQGVLGELSPEINEVIDTMLQSNANLLQMVNTLLEVYRYEADRKVLNFTVVNLITVVQQVIKELTPLAEEKGLELIFDCPQSFALNVFGDRLELHRLVTNLIGNGIQFTEKGKITIKLSQVKENNQLNESWIILQVQDTGVGISLEEQKWLFDRFRSGKHRRSGSGLGLHLCRQIVESHQGKIEVKSELKQGSLFIVCLPAMV